MEPPSEARILLLQSNSGTVQLRSLLLPGGALVAGRPTKKAGKPKSGSRKDNIRSVLQTQLLRAEEQKAGSTIKLTTEQLATLSISERTHYLIRSPLISTRRFLNELKNVGVVQVSLPKAREGHVWNDLECLKLLT